MLKQIRRSVFETNSSSTHTIAIAKNLFEENTDYELSQYDIYGYGESGFQFGRVPKIENSIGRRIAYSVIVFLSYPKRVIPVEDRILFYEKIYGILERNLKNKLDCPYCDTKEKIISSVMKLIQFCEQSCYEYCKEWKPTYTIENEIFKNKFAYIDHIEETEAFYKKITTDDSALERFIMAKNSFVYSGGDEYNGYYMPRVGFEYDYETQDEFMEKSKEMAEKLDIEVFFKGN